MKIAVLDNITGFGKHDWSAYWVLIWFICGLLALFFWLLDDDRADGIGLVLFIGICDWSAMCGESQLSQKHRRQWTWDACHRR